MSAAGTPLLHYNNKTFGLCQRQRKGRKTAGLRGQRQDGLDKGAEWRHAIQSTFLIGLLAEGTMRCGDKLQCHQDRIATSAPEGKSQPCRGLGKVIVSSHVRFLLPTLPYRYMFLGTYPLRLKEQLALAALGATSPCNPYAFQLQCTLQDVLYGIPHTFLPRGDWLKTTLLVSCGSDLVVG